MRKKNIIYTTVVLAVLVAMIAGCKKWDDHNAITDPKSDKDLFVQITENANLSKFAALLVKSGLDKEISSSKTYTVYAPTNAALATLDPAVENDSARLRDFVSNHIARQSYYAAVEVTRKRIPMMNGKYHNIMGKLIDDATISGPDQFAKNGVLQVIDKMLPFLNSSWQFLENDPDMPSLQKTFMKSLMFKVFDATNAVEIGVDSSGKPIYQPGTDSIITNIFWRNVYDLRDESKEFTFFVQADAAWTAESERLVPYYTDTSALRILRYFFTQQSMINDYAIEGAFDKAALPDTIVSKFNVKLGIDKGSIIKTIRTSNGYVHIMSRLTVRQQDKFKEIRIEAENWNTQSADRNGNRYIREMYDTANNRRFRDLVMFNHGLATYNLGYRVNGVPAGVKYRAYWVAVNSGISTVTTAFTQKLGIDTATSVKYLNYVTVPYNSYAEQLLGEFTFPNYRNSMFFYLTAANTTTASANIISCDYIRLVPVSF